MSKDTKKGIENQGRDVLVDVIAFLSNAESYRERAVKATILFADLAGSTAFKAKYNIIQGLAKVVQHNEVVRHCVESFKGSVIKYLGDGVMALFEHKDQEQRALMAGIKTIEETKQANERQGWEYPFSIDTKIGVHSGPVWMFKYSGSSEDPQGTTVDIAARLCSVAQSNQVLCTKRVYQAACKKGGIPKPKDGFKQYLKGVKERQDIVVLMPENYQYHPADVQSMPPDLEAKLTQAYRLGDEKKLDEAFEEWKRISEEYPDSYIANICVAEHMLRESGSSKVSSKLDDIENVIDKTMCTRPDICQAWLLRGLLHFKRFSLDGDKAQITKAINCVRIAAKLACSWRNTGGMLRSKVCLIHFLQTFASVTEDKNALDEARQLCVDLLPLVEHAFNDCRSDFYVANVSVQLQSGSTDYEALEQMLKKAENLNPRNFRVREVQLELAKKRYPNGGIAGVVSSSPLAYIV